MVVESFINNSHTPWSILQKINNDTDIIKMIPQLTNKLQKHHNFSSAKAILHKIS